MIRAHHLLPLFLLLLLGLPMTGTTTAAADPPAETFRYRWSLGGVTGAVAGLFLPSQGEGVLSYERGANGRIKSELLITSEKSDKGEFWRYGSEIDPRDGSSTRAWSSYLWRGKKKSKQQDIATSGVRDIVAGIYALRADPPTASRDMEIWSDGKIYPVSVIPRGEEMVKLGDRRVAARRFSIRGRDDASGRQWKGSMEVWLSKDDAATPVMIQIERSLAKLRLQLETSR